MSTATVDLPNRTYHNGSYGSIPPANGVSKPAIGTSVPMTVTPATAIPNSISSSSPASAFPESSPPTPRTMSETMTVEQSVSRQESPPPSLHLTQAPIADISSPNSSFSSMGDVVQKSKGPGLIRRLSRGAHNRLRRRPSTTHTNRMRDQSAGPVLVRRRSDSTGASDMGGDMSDLELEHPSEEFTEDNSSSITSVDPPNALGISTGRRSTASTFEGGIAPTISSVLEQGTVLLKVTRKSRKPLKFRLDTGAAKVCWHPTNPEKQFFIDDVRDIRIGEDARSSREDIYVPPEQESCWMTILYDKPEGSKGRVIKFMHLIAPNEFILKLWTDALKTFERERIEVMNALSANAEKSERAMQMIWKQAMTRKRVDNEQDFDFEDAKWICRKLEINCSTDAVRRHFNDADRGLVGTLTYAQYEQFLGSFKVRKDIQAVYYSVKPINEPEMSMETFFKFLREGQSIDVDKDRILWENRFESHCRQYGPRDAQSTATTPNSLNLQGFQNFLTSSSNNCLGSNGSSTTLERPLNEYFISSSHNTYLLGRQVAGASSVEGYIAALVKGCRCIEIDCWDGKDGRPVVNHGRTLSTECLFEDCIAVIHKYAFTSTSYPLIISLEVHCCPAQQAAMVKIMTKKFGDMLLAAPLMTHTSTLPSPEELRNRILIKVKSASKSDDGQRLGDQSNGRRQRSHSSPFTRGAPFDSATLPLCPSPGYSGSDSPQPRPSNTWSTPRGSTTSGTGASASSSSSDSENATPSLDRKKKGKTSKVIQSLGELGVYACGIKYSGFNVPEAKLYNHIYSLAETVSDRICRDPDTKRQMEMHNLRHLMRVYPAARRIDSSNFNPLQSWKRGVQMAALNWQTYDVNMQVNQAMFAAGVDRTGYVLKPEELRHARYLPMPDVATDNQISKERRGMKFVKFSVEIISAQRLPRPRNHNPDLGMNPYIEFEMHSAEDKARGMARGEGGVDASARDGSSGIGSPLRKRTKIAEGNGFDPVFNQPISMTVETKYPGLMFVRWTVWNSPDGRNLSSNSTMLATFTAKLGGLQQGYRHLPLFNAYGERYRDAKLFVKIKKEAPIPLNADETTYVLKDISNSPRLEPIRSERSWSRKIFNRTPSERKKSREPSPYGSFSRTSSIERC